MLVRLWLLTSSFRKERIPKINRLSVHRPLNCCSGPCLSANPGLVVNVRVRSAEADGIKLNPFYEFPLRACNMILTLRAAWDYNQHAPKGRMKNDSSLKEFDFP